MADAAYENAVARRDVLAKENNDLLQRLDEVRKELAHVSKWLDDYARFAGAPANIVASAPVPEPEAGYTANEKRQRPKNPSRESVASESLRLIREAGHPLPRTELFNALRDSGTVIEGKDPEMVLSTMLWRSENEIARIKGHGYWPADEPYAPAGYVPRDHSN